MRGTNTTAYILLTLTALFWAGTIIVGRVVADDVPPLSLNFWRWVVALIFIAPFGLRGLRKRWSDVVRHWRLLVVLGVLNMTGFGSFLFLGLKHTEAINGSLLLGTMPVNIIAVAWLITREKITPVQGIGILVGFLGLLTIVARADLSVLLGMTFNLGDPVIWLSILFYAFYSVYLPRAPKDLPLASLMTVLCAVGVVTCLPFYLWETYGEGLTTLPSLDALWAIVYLGVFSSLLAQIFWVAGINRVGPSTAGNFIYLAPVFGTIMAILLLGETFRWFHAVGIALVFAGVYLATRKPANMGANEEGGPEARPE